MTIARKLWLGFGVLILIFLVADLTILLSAATMNRDLAQIVSVEEQARTAAYEMEINTVEIGRDVRIYSLNGDPRYRELRKGQGPVRGVQGPLRRAGRHPKRQGARRPHRRVIRGVRVAGRLSDEQEGPTGHGIHRGTRRVLETAGRAGQPA